MIRKKRSSKKDGTVLERLNETKQEWVSRCCEAKVRVEGRTTQFYVCSCCDQACDVYRSS